MSAHIDQVEEGGGKRSRGAWRGVVVLVGLAVVALLVARHFLAGPGEQATAASLPVVSVSTPLKQELETRLQFLGQFAPVQNVELRAQVGGTLTRIAFKDGDIVHRGDLLFEIDPTPYRIKLSQGEAQLERAKTQVEKARAQVERARVRLDLAGRELARAQTLQKTEAGTVENVEQRSAERQSAQAAAVETEAVVHEAEAMVREAEALIRDARFDLDHCRITAPFTGRIGNHLASVGNLISGSRNGGSSTTLLATIVSLNPIYLNFDMSEADYMTFLREQKKQKGSLANKVEVSLSDEKSFGRQGVLNFVDNTIDRSSGTIHARALLQNSDLLLTPGAFGRVRLGLSSPVEVLLVPDASVLADLSEHIVLTVGPDDVVSAKKVQRGDMRYGLRVIKGGLNASDKVIIDGITTVAPGSKVSAKDAPVRVGSDQE